MHSFRIPGLLRRATNVFALSAIGLFGFVSCQQDPPSAPIGPVTYTAEFPPINSIHLRPQSAKWSIAPNDSGSAKLAGSVTQPIAEIELASPPNNTVWITAIRAGVKAFSLSYAYDNSTKLKLLNETKDRIYYPVNSEILRKIYPASDKQSFDEQLAKLLVDGDKLVDTIEISDLVAGGVDTFSVFREAMKYMVAKNQSIEQIAASWSLRIDLAKVHERIRLLAEEGLITDTSVIFPRYPVRVKDPVSLPEMAPGGSVAVQGAFEGDSGLSSLGSKVFQGDAAVSGFKLTFSVAVNGTQKTWDLAKDAEATLSADASVTAGTYTLAVWMLDAGNRSDTSRATFQVKSTSVDNDPPVMEWIAPTGETILENADSVLVVKVTATDASGVESVSIGGGAATLADGIWSLAVTVPVVDTGYVVEVVAKDAKGNESKKSSRVYRKAPAVVGAPVLTLLAPSAKTGNSVPFESTYVVARWKIEDATSEIDEASILIAGIAATKEGDGIWSARVPLAPTGEDVVVRIAAKNKKGLEAQDEFKVLREKDATVPTIVAILGSRTLEHGATTAAVSWSVTDNHKLKSVTIQGKPVIGVDGVYGVTVDVAGGDNLIVIEAIDSTGNIATNKATLVLPVDGTLPKIDFGASARTVAFDSAKVPVVVKVTDDRGIASVWIDGVLASGVDGVYSSIVDLPVGGRQILVKALDVSGNTTTDSVKIIRSKDEVSPKIAMVSGGGGVPYETTSAILVWKVTENDRVAKVTIKGEVVTSSDIIYSDTVALVAGENRFPIYAEDATGNKAYDTIVVTRGGDAVKPVITLVSPSKDTTVSETQESLEMVFRVSDNEKVASVKIGTEEITGDAGVYKKTLNPSVGANAIEVVARDASGNESKSTLVITRSADVAKPLIVAKSPSKDTTVADATNSIALSFDVTDNVGVKSVSIGGSAATGSGSTYSRTVSLAYGTNSFEVVALDATGNESKSTLKVTRPDQTKPVIVLKTPIKDTTVSDATASFVISMTVTDNVGVDSVKIGGALVPVSAGVYSRTVTLSAGSNSFDLVAKDAAGNESKSTLVITRSADIVKPTILAKSPSKDTTVADATNSIALSFDVTDNVGVSSVSIGGSAVTGSGSTYSRTVSLAYGVNLIGVVAKDGANNESKDTLVVTRLDQTKPVIVSKSPTKDTTVSDATTSFAISVTVTDNVGVKSVSIGGVAATGSGTTYSRTVNLAVGANSFDIVARDAAGNESKSTLVITRSADAAKPVIVAKSPTKDTTVADATSSIALSFDVTDNLGVGSVSIGGVAATKSGNTYSRTVSLAYGANSFEVVAEDVSGLKSTTQIVVTRLDQTKPVIVLRTPTKDTTVSDATSSFAVSVTITDNVGVYSVTIGGVSVSPSGGIYGRRVNLAYGANIVKVEVTDEAGNSATISVTLTRTIDPVQSVTLSDVNGSLRAGSFDVTLSCATTGAKIYYTLDGEDPTELSTLYSSAIRIDSTRTLKARAFLSPRAPSAIASQKYNLAVPVSVSGGGDHSLVLMSDGSLWGFGNNYRNTFTSGTTGRRPTPTKIDVDVMQMSAGNSFSMWVKKDGSLWAIGKNDSGAFALGNTTSQTTPVRIMDGVQKVASLWEGSSLILMKDGSLYASGENAFGQLGVGTIGSFSEKKWVADNVVDMAGGFGHTFFLKADGTYWSMGVPFNGRLGLPGDTIVTRPTQAMDGVAVIQPSQGQQNLVGKTDGTLWSFGYNVGGALGTGDKVDVLLPTKVNGISGKVKATVTGGAHALVLTDNGVLWGIGTNNYEQLGSEFPSETLTPKILTTGVKAIGAGNTTTLFIRDDNTLWGMGDNAYGQLGQSTLTATEPLVRIKF